MAAVKPVVRLAAVGDLHYARTAPGMVQSIFAQAAERADVLVLCGDLTDYGTPEEARLLAKDLGTARIPVVAVLGNHDYEAGKQDEVRKILADAGAYVLDGDACELQGVGFAGVKGFAGGFGPRALGPWGEETIKLFVREAVEEALKLEAALAKLRVPQRVAIVHYAPIQATVEGEPPEIYAFLGSSRLEEPLNRYAVTAVFHGHAHHGRLEGRTLAGAPVYNVCLPLLLASFPGEPGFRVVEIPIMAPEAPRERFVAGQA